ncbi:hybrid sensor histidine kinase/response regulator [Magnetospirillum sp. SS-4]|uniref:hybrid sensor histidine kinase/response regulator n=1 Tax=Magnetospirillum sp. SS-4 TaxID=2681465 RepID=UPI00138593CE|nr:hybrid sensor histidine kinase/response regulator [Magnetospirillum sp. SS-4]CAA7616169.1 Signal transduction histidine kinase [Magnetospirillum sp. SS-4]
MSPPIRILLLEDDPADARLVGQMLRRVKTTPFEVVVVSRLSEAVARLEAGSAAFDVVLADLGLPDSTGIATLDALTGAAPRLPVVVLTGNDDDAIALEALKRGAQDYLVKGIGDAFILSRVVRYAIERKLTEAALREARDTAEQAARAKTLFLAMMGHEIRTPLNGVLGMARLLMESGLDGRQRVFAETLVSSGELLLGLVNDILDFSRLDASGLTLESEPFDLIDTLEEVRLILASRADEKGLSLALRCASGLDRPVLGDRLRLRQILFNLVGNAIKFTDSGGVVVTADHLENGMVRISVIDTGIGISGEARPHLFTEFWQGDSGAARRFAGAGLGLAICARLVALMGGAIDCVSELGRGTTFMVDLPLTGRDERLPHRESPEGRPCGPHAILLVDDNQVNREVAAGLLERRGHKVSIACDGFEAVDKARSGGFDLVLLDMRMPGMDGIETARAIAALPGAAGKVPLVLLTANPMVEDEARWREVGIRGCLAKPFRIDDLGRLLAGLEDGGAATASEPPLLVPSGLQADLRDLGAERMAGLAALYRRSSFDDLVLIREHCRSGRLDDLAKVAHRMAGAASSLHLALLAARCRSLEDTARRSDSPGCAAGLDDLEELWTRSAAALDEALGGQPATSR